MKLWILFSLSLAVLLIANFFPMVRAYFPWNLPFCFMGGVATTLCAIKLFERRNR